MICVQFVQIVHMSVVQMYVHLKVIVVQRLLVLLSHCQISLSCSSYGAGQDFWIVPSAQHCLLGLRVL